MSKPKQMVTIAVERKTRNKVQKLAKRSGRKLYAEVEALAKEKLAS